jgi:hypothetical protein
MKTITTEPIENMVKSMRQIREEISNEIKDMTYAEERAFLDKLLQKKQQKNILNTTSKAKGTLS